MTCGYVTLYLFVIVKLPTASNTFQKSVWTLESVLAERNGDVGRVKYK